MSKVSSNIYENIKNEAVILLYKHSFKSQITKAMYVVAAALIFNAAIHIGISNQILNRHSEISQQVERVMAEQSRRTHSVKKAELNAVEIIKIYSLLNNVTLKSSLPHRPTYN